MKTYYALWKEKEHRFEEAILYDFALKIEYPHLVFEARDLKEAVTKIEAINSEIKGIDRFTFKIKKGL